MIRRAVSASSWRGVLPPLLAGKGLWLAITLAVVAVRFGAAGAWLHAWGSLASWDAISYLDIAAAGYPAHLDYHDAFLPGFPLVIWAVALLVRDVVVASWLVTFAAEAVALWYVYRLVLAERDRQSATFATWLLALAPTALFLTAPFTEAPFIAAAAAALFYARRGRPLAAAIAATLACTIRLTGLALLPALVLEQLSRDRWRPRRTLVYVLLIPLPILLYCGYMGIRTGDPLAFFSAQASPSFGHQFTAPWDGFGTTWNTMVTAHDGEVRSIFAREVAFGLLGLVLCFGMWMSTRIPRSFALYATIAWLMTASLSFWRSEPRYILALFPAVILVCDVTARARRLRPVIAGMCAVLSAIGIAVFAEGRWLG
jgi:hypothetical protein